MHPTLLRSKDDLDAALGAAVSSKDVAAQSDARAKAARARGELQQAQQEVRGGQAGLVEHAGGKGSARPGSSGKIPVHSYAILPSESTRHRALPFATQLAAAASDKERKAAQRRADQAAQRVQQYEQRLAGARALAAEYRERERLR